MPYSKINLSEFLTNARISAEMRRTRVQKKSFDNEITSRRVTQLQKIITFVMSRTMICIAVLFAVNVFNTLAGVTNNESLVLSSIQQTNSNQLCFMRNDGQIIDHCGLVRPDILFKTQRSGFDIYLRERGLSYVYSEQLNDRPVEHFDNPSPDSEPSSRVVGFRLDVEFRGAQLPNAQPVQKIASYDNFYLPQCEKGIQDVKSYRKVSYEEIYEGIDVVFYPGESSIGLKYDIIVKEGGEVSDVVLGYDGHKSLWLENGKIQIATPMGTLEESIPIAYQVIAGIRREVKAEYKIRRNEVTFEVGKYDKKYDLIIDPWVTYYGGSLREEGNGITADSHGNIYVTGMTWSLDFPNTTGSFDSTLAGNKDAFIMKMNPAGKRLWSTYFGGSMSESGKGIVSDRGQFLYTNGFTDSQDLPVPSGFQAASGGSRDMYLARFDTSGAINWATYYGGSGFDNAYSIDLDNTGNFLVIGNNTLGGFPIPVSAYQSIQGGKTDMVISKHNASTGLPIWATYLGGSLNDFGYGLVANSLGDVFICGETLSDDFPVSNAFQSTIAGGPGTYDMILAKMDGLTGDLSWSTYYGGTEFEHSYDVTVDSKDNVLMTGWTASANFPVMDAFQATLNDSSDAVVVKFDAGGQRLWATYLGGSGDEESFGIAVNGNDEIYVAGDTYSVDFPRTACGLQASFGGEEDNFLARYSEDGQLLCASYLGGSSHDEILSGGVLTTYGKFVYLTGMTPGSYPVSNNAFQTNYGGGDYDVSVSKFCGQTCGQDVIDPTNVSFTANNTALCEGDTVDLTSVISSACDTTGMNWTWTIEGGNPSTFTGRDPSGIIFDNAGSFDVKLVFEACEKDSIVLADYIIVAPCGCAPLLASASINQSVLCKGDCNAVSTATTMSSASPFSYNWSNGESANMAVTLCAGSHAVTITDSAGCDTTINVLITEPEALLLSSVTDSAHCAQFDGEATAVVSGGEPGYNYQWDAATGGQTTSAIIGLQSGSYTILVTDNNGCTATMTADVGEIGAPVLSVGDAGICAGEEIMLDAGIQGLTYLWSPNGETSQAIVVIQAGNYTVVATDQHNCSGSSSATISFLPMPSLNLGVDTMVCLSGITLFGGDGNHTYIWSTGATSSSIIAITEGSYWVDKSNGSCSTADTISVSINDGSEQIHFIPNTFSPNNDGVNDVFIPVLDPFFGEMTFTIYDRWGSEVFITNNPMGGWTGIIEDELAQTGAYVWMLAYDYVCDGEEMKQYKFGNVTLLK